MIIKRFIFDREWKKFVYNLIIRWYFLLFFFFFFYIRDILSRKKKFFLISFEQTLVERNDTNSSELNSLSIDFFFFFWQNRLSLLKLLMEVGPTFNQSGND